MRKSFLALALALIMVLSMAVSVNASTPTAVSVNSPVAAQGSKVTLSVTLAPATTVGSMYMYFDYDPAVLEFKDSAWTEVITSKAPQVQDAGIDPVVKFDGNKQIGGKVFTITFIVKDDAVIGSSTDVTIETTIRKVVGNSFDTIVLDDVTATIKVVCPYDHSSITDDGKCDNEHRCPTCNELIIPAGHKDKDGNKLCDVCGEDLSEKCMHRNTHTVQENVVKATCVEGSYEEVVYCDDCGEEISRTKKTIDPTDDHKDDTHDERCDVCGEFLGDCAHAQTSVIEEIAVPATCVDNGSKISTVYCIRCHRKLSASVINIPATGRHYDGNNDSKCDVCGTVISEQHVHNLVHSVAKAATCTEDGNVEYWYCEGCDSYFTDAEGKNKVDAAAVVVPAAHKVEHVAAKEATETEDGNVEYWHCPECGGVWLDAECTTAAKLEDVVIPATGHVHNLVYTAAKEATCFEEGNLEYWYCEGCDCYFTDAEGKYNIARLSLILPVAHDIVHVEAKAATCFEEGNIEHWYCTKCGYAWLDEFCTKNTNLKAVILPVSHKVEHVEAKAPTCFEEGNIEYWYCTECGYAWLDELCIKNTNLLAVILPVSHNIVHVEAKAPTEKENGNIEYWYCTECGYAWLDELCTKNTNLKAVILPATGAEINPPTGDATILYIAAVAVIATLGVAVIRFKKREEN